QRAGRDRRHGAGGAGAAGPTGATQPSAGRAGPAAPSAAATRRVISPADGAPEARITTTARGERREAMGSKQEKNGSCALPITHRLWPRARSERHVWFGRGRDSHHFDHRLSVVRAQAIA